MRRNRAGFPAFAAFVALLATPLCRAVAQTDDEDELVLMNEPTSFTDVVDAFDDHDPFDVNVTLGYVRTWELGRLQRETNATTDERMTRDWLDVADYSREVNQLMLGLDVGIFRDLALYARLPIILSDDRSLSRIGGADPSSIIADRASGTPLFEVEPGAGFRSPTRSGVDWLSVGAAWSILNQHRDPHVPTWVIMLEGRFNLGEPMHACNERQLMDPATGARGRSCLTGQRDSSTGMLLRGTDPGVGRGVNALRAETRGSFRYEYVEPYAGLAFQMEWPGSGDRFFLPGGNLAGYINDLPPIQGRFTAGIAIMPWEDREHHQRFSIDLRFTGDYFSEGHDYSPLFDALGSSNNPHLAQPVLEGQPGEGGDVAGLQEVSFYGLTDTQSHARLGGTIILEMQAARYVRFNVQTTVMHTPSYVITQADACNPNVGSPPGGDERLLGTCRSGIINPHHRPAIDLPGQRFRMESLTQIDVAAYVTAMF